MFILFKSQISNFYFFVLLTGKEVPLFLLELISATGKKKKKKSINKGNCDFLSHNSDIFLENLSSYLAAQRKKEKTQL